MSSDARAPIRRAILSVTDKTGLVDFAQKLAGMGVELISTGGTAKMLRASGISVKDISELTGKSTGGFCIAVKILRTARQSPSTGSSRSTWWW